LGIFNFFIAAPKQGEFRMKNLGTALHMRMVRVVNMMNGNGSHDNGREEQIPTREDGPYIFSMLIAPNPMPP
jgi:hypothetical protein